MKNEAKVMKPVRQQVHHTIIPYIKYGGLNAYSNCKRRITINN